MSWQKLLSRKRHPLAVSYGPIGVDLALEKMNLLQIASTADGLSVHAAHSVPYPESREVLLATPKKCAEFIRQGVREKPFKGQKVVTCLPAAQVRIHNLSYHLRPEQTAEEGVVEALRAVTGNNLEGLVVDYLPVRNQETDARAKTALAVTARHDEVVAYLDMFNAAHLEVQALDLGPAALKRLLTTMNPATELAPVLLINFGQQHSYLTVVAGQRLLMDREVNFGEGGLSKRLCDVLDLEPEQGAELLSSFGFTHRSAFDGTLPGAEEEREILESISCLLKPLLLEFAEEVNKVLIYTASESRGLGIERIYLLGCMARYPGMAQMMTETLALPTEILNPFDHIRVPTQDALSLILNDTAGIAMATGLALRGITTHE